MDIPGWQGSSEEKKQAAVPVTLQVLELTLLFIMGPPTDHDTIYTVLWWHMIVDQKSAYIRYLLLLVSISHTFPFFGSYDSLELDFMDIDINEDEKESVVSVLYSFDSFTQSQKIITFQFYNNKLSVIGKDEKIKEKSPIAKLWF